VVLQFTYEEIRDEPHKVAAEITAGLAPSRRTVSRPG